MRPLTLVLATGGTGGHIYPALAVADRLAARGARPLVLGQHGGMEARVVPEHGLPFVGVRAGKWDRQRPDPRQALAALGGLVDAVRAVRRERPDLVVGFGGFASFPGCAAALLTRTPLVLHEGNAFPGRVTRLFAGRARALVLAQEEAAARLPRGPEAHLLPVPVRERRVPRDEARRALGLPVEATVTLVMGGSQGSLALNRALPEAYRALGRDDVTVLHSTGPRWHEEVVSRTRDLERYHARPYLDATLAWSAADLAVTRAGISTLSEAALHGVPVIAIPLPTSAEDHQRHNARALEAAGAGRMVDESRIGTLHHAWRELLEPPARAAAATAMARRSPAGAADALAGLLERIAREPRTAPTETP